MKKLTIGLFSDSTNAEKAVREMKSKNLGSDISIIAKEEAENYKTYLDPAVNKIQIRDNKSSADGILAGGILGGIVGFLIGASAVAVPGGFLVVGPIAGSILGVAGGATLGALTGSLIDLGVTEEQVQILTDRLNKGEVAVIVESDESKDGEVRKVMNKHGVKLIEQYK
ncbi:MAG: DUF1269 domain-containing protein [Candidatus Dojkabacteria bacterium]|nr:DUF1269 domain-containing protein [Candidatus Dojkabacteria bacterium]